MKNVEYNRMIDLSDFEKRLSSEEFIEKVNSLFINTRNSEDGISRLRLRKDNCKKLIEELLPISQFLKVFERPGLDLYCEYFSGNQNFDAKIYCGGWFVEQQVMCPEYFLEVSVSIHPKDHLKRECLEKGIPCFGGNNIERLKDGTIQSLPRVFTPDDLINEHFEYIKSRIEDKVNKEYPDKTYLIIPLFPDTLIMQDEWIEIIKKLIDYFKLERSIAKFCGLFIYDSISQRSIFL